jgi:hypothetical protein
VIDEIEERRGREPGWFAGLDREAQTRLLALALNRRSKAKAR